MQAPAKTLEAPRLRVRSPIAPTGSRHTRSTSGGRPQTGGKIASQYSGWLFWTLLTAVLYFGWSQRDEGYIVAESGLGYALGIVGGSLMLLLLLYHLPLCHLVWCRLRLCRLP